MYSLTVKELKKWINSIPAAIDMEQVEYLSYEGEREPRLDISIMFKKTLQDTKSTSQKG